MTNDQTEHQTKPQPSPGSSPRSSPLSKQAPMHRGITLFRIFNIEIGLDLSVLIIFALIVYSLGDGLFPNWHPDWSPLLCWTTAFVSGILFFASLLAHELSHAVVAQKHGIPVPRITLFLFGGIAEISQEPDRPKVEFLIAIAGPAMSIFIGLVCSQLAYWNISDALLIEQLTQGEEAALGLLGPWQTSLMWLGSINLILAAFNLIPGFPMDGGRVFRAIAWAATGDKVKATHWASNLGRAFGWTLMAIGVITLFQGGGFASMWWIMIGWFISHLATTAYQQMLTELSLHGLKVSDLMRTRFEQVPSDTHLSHFIDQYLLRSSQKLWPVTINQNLAGFVSMADVITLPPEEKSNKTVLDIMRPLESTHYLSPELNVQDALTYLATAGESIPVLDQGAVVGIIQHDDILRWMTLHLVTDRQ